MRNADTQALGAMLARRRQVSNIIVAEKNRLGRATTEVRPRIVAHITWLEQELQDLDGDLRRRIRSSPVWREKDAQLRALRDHAKKYNHLVVREYVDEAESGRIANRPQFRRMIEEARKPEAPFQEILVWKFSRFTRKREHAVAFKSMLRRKGIRVISITEHADDSPTGKLMEAIIESVDEFYSENLAQEVIRGMREAAIRGFWVTPTPPTDTARSMYRTGPKRRPRLEMNEKEARVVRRIFGMALRGKSTLDITRVLNGEGIASPRGKRWLKTSVQKVLDNETYTRTLIWGRTSKSVSNKSLCYPERSMSP